MSEAVRSTARPGSPDLLDDLDGSSVSFAGLDIFERVWRLFISMRTGLALILVLALLTLIGTLVVQAPAGMTADKQAYAAWLDSAARPKYGGWTNVFDILGFFSIFSSLLFRSLTVLLSASILACSINRAPKLWHQAVHPRTTMSGSFYAHAALRAHVEVPADADRAVAALEHQLRGGGYRTVIQPAPDGGTDIYADKFRWGPFGTVFAHLSIILILVGAMAGAAGFRDQRFVAPVGSKVAVGNGTNLTVEATSFMDSYYASGEPSDYASHLVLYDGDRQVADQTIRVNQPLRYGDITFYQSFFGAAADIQINDATGASVFDQGVALQWTSTDGKQVIGQIDLPKQGLTIYAVEPASGEVDPVIKAGMLQFEVYKADATQAQVGQPQLVSPGKPVTIGDLTYTFIRDRQFTGLIVARDPGVLFVWGGALILVFGVWLVFFFPNRRIWARVRPAEAGAVVEAGALTRHDVMFESGFAKLIGNVQQELGAPSAS